MIKTALGKLSAALPDIGGIKMHKTQSHRDTARNSVIKGIALIASGFNILDGQQADYRFSKDVTDSLQDAFIEIVRLVEEGKIIEIPPEKRDAKFQSFMKSLMTS